MILKLTPCYLKITSANSNVYSVQTHVGYARSAKSYTIPKQTETIVMVKASRRKPNDVVLLEPLDQLSSLNLVAANSLVQVKISRGFFKIMNPTDKKRIPFNNLLAVICVVDDTSVSDFDAPVSSFEHQS